MKLEAGYRIKTIDPLLWKADEEIERIYKKLEEHLSSKLVKILLDGKPRCVQSKRSQEVVCRVTGIREDLILRLEVMTGFLNSSDAEIGDLVHHSGMLSVAPNASTTSRIGAWLTLPIHESETHIVTVCFEKISENWWRRIS